MDSWFIPEPLPNSVFPIRLDTEDMLIGYVSGKIRHSFLRILTGNRVKIEVNRYDSTREHIIYQLCYKDLKD